MSHLRLIGFPFRRLLRIAGITVEVFLPASTRGLRRMNQVYVSVYISTSLFVHRDVNVTTIPTSALTV
jgi:hypothetical protein